MISHGICRLGYESYHTHNKTQCEVLLGVQLSAEIITLIRTFLNEESFSSCFERLRFDVGDIIVFEHQSDRDMYIIENGSISIKKHDQADIQMGSGTLIGELSFLQGARRTATIIASKETQCVQIQEKPFVQWLEKYPEKSILFYRLLSLAIADRLRSTIQREDTRLLFGKESAILRQSEQKILVLAHRLRDHHMLAQAKKKTIESEMRDSLKRLQAEQEEDETSEIFWVTENTEESLFSNRFVELEGIYRQLFERTQNIFSSLNNWLNRFQAEEMRMEIATRAREQFSHILEKTTIYREILLSGGTESSNLMSEVLLQQSIDSNEKAISEAICAQETIQSYRAQVVWYQKSIRAIQYQDINSVTIINDITGVLFSMIYPLCAPYPIAIHFLVDNPYSFGCVDVNFQQYGKAKYIRQRIQDWMSDVIEGSLIQKQQDCIFLYTILDYLSTSHATRLLVSLRESLRTTGTLYFSVLSNTSDSSFFCDFLGWSTIRRTKEEVRELLNSAGYKNIVIERLAGSLCVIAKNN